MAYSTNVPSKPYTSGTTIKRSPLKETLKSGSISTARDTKKGK